MTPSTVARIARLYEQVVGYHPFEDEDWTPVEALEGLRWMRTALILCHGDPTTYTGPTLTKRQLVSGEWSGHPDPNDPDNVWINDITGRPVVA